MRRLWAVWSVLVLLAAATAAGAQGHAHLTITPDNADQVDLLATFGRGAFWRLIWSPNGDSLAVATTAGVWLLDAETLDGERLLEGYALDEVTALAFSPRGDALAISTAAGEIRLWPVRGGSPLDRALDDRNPLMLQHGTREVDALLFSPDGTLLASAGRDDVVRLWDVATGTQVHALEGHTLPPVALAFDDDGARLKSGGMDDAVRTWDVATGAQIAVEDWTYRSTAFAAFNADRTMYATGYSTPLGLYTFPARTLIRELPGHTTAVRDALAFSSDGTRLAAGSFGGLLTVHDVATGELLARRGDFSPRELYTPRSVAFNPRLSRDGVRLLVSYATESWLWDVASGERLHRLERVPGASIGGDWRRDYAPTVASLRWGVSVYGGNEGIVSVYDRVTGDRLHQLACSSQVVWGVTFDADGAVLLALDGADAVCLWEVAAGPDGGAQFTALGRYELLSLDEANGAPPPLWYVNVAVQDRLILLTDDSAVLHTLAGPYAGVNGLTFDPLGRWFAVSSVDGVVRLYGITPPEPPAAPVQSAYLPPPAPAR